MTKKSDPFLDWIRENIVEPAWQATLSASGRLNKERTLGLMDENFGPYPTEREIYKERAYHQQKVRDLNAFDKKARKDRVFVESEEDDEYPYQVSFPGWEDVVDDRVTFWVDGEQHDEATAELGEEELEAVLRVFRRRYMGLEQSITFYASLLRAVRIMGVRKVRELY
jgi:hypothetical protein